MIRSRTADCLLFLLAFAAMALARVILAQGQTVAPTTQPATRPIKFLSPLPMDADDSPQIRAAWVAGDDVILEPGVWHILTPCYRPFHASIRGESEYGTIIVVGGTEPATHEAAFFGTQQGFNQEGPETVPDGGVIADMTLDSTDSPGHPIYANGADEPGMTFENLRIIHGRGPQCTSTGSTWNNIEFDHSAAMLVSNNAIYENLSWYGAPDAGSNECLFGGSNDLMQHCLWEDTCRGIVFRYPTTNFYGEGLRFHDIDAGSGNANEVILQEASGPFTNSVIDTVQMLGCRGALVQLGIGTVNNVTLSHFNIDSRGGLSIGTNYTAGATMGLNGTSVTAIHITQWEAKSFAGFFWDGATGNTVDNTAIISPRPTEGGQLTPMLGVTNAGYRNFNSPTTVDPCVFNSMTGNTVDPKTVAVIDLPAGWALGVGGQ